MESTKQRRNFVHTRQMGINKDVWQIPQVKEEGEHEGYQIFDFNSHFEQQYTLPRKLTMDLKEMKWNQDERLLVWPLFYEISIQTNTGFQNSLEVFI